MAASQLSLRATELYRNRLQAIRLRVEQDAERRWRALMPEDLNGRRWSSQTAAGVAQAQKEAIRATQGYLAAYLTLELGRRSIPPVLATSGVSRDGRPLDEAYLSPAIGTKVALRDGKPLDEALAAGLRRAVRAVEVDTMHAARTALVEAIDQDDRFEGWQRALRGTCGACAGAARGPERGVSFPIHPGCACVAEPIVRDVPNRFPRPTGAELFAAKSSEEQDAMLGAEAAELVRSGAAALPDLVERSHLEEAEDFITQKPIEAL